MKKIITVLSTCILLSSTNTMNAQRVGISTDGSVPDASAMLDVKSTSRGMLVPRMTSSQRTAIASPAQGLLVFDNVTNSFWFYKGLVWTELAAGGSTTNYWSANGANIFKNNAGNVGIGINTPAALLHIKKDGEAVRIQGALPSIGFFDNSSVYKGFVWQGPGDNISLGTAVGNSLGKIELYNNGILNMSLANLGVMEVSGSFPQIRLKQNGTISGAFRADGLDAELSAFKPDNTNDTRGNLLLQLDLAGDFASAYAGNVGIKTDNPVNILQIGNAPGFSGNQLAIGNGSKGMSFFQNASTSHWYSSTNFALMPAASGAGRVGIGTTTPSEKLQIAGGNVKIVSGDLQMDNGKIVTPQTGTFNMIPLCYGKVVIGNNGTVDPPITFTATPNVIVIRKEEGIYRIYSGGITENSIILVTELSRGQFKPYHVSAQFITNGEMEVLTVGLRDLIDPPQFQVPWDTSFYFVIYN